MYAVDSWLLTLTLRMCGVFVGESLQEAGEYPKTAPWYELQTGLSGNTSTHRTDQDRHSYSSLHLPL